MTMMGDRITSLLAREFIRGSAADPPLRIVAATTVSSVVAALAARRLGAPELAIATGFGTLDGSPVPTLSLLESGLGSDTSPQGSPADTFMAVAKGWVGVVVAPAQLDALCRTNLSRIGGTNDRPGVALPGSRGLPDNNDSPSRVWYLVLDHSPRQLVAEVDFVSGPGPSQQQERRLITRRGVFAYGARTGWTAAGLFAEAHPADVVVDGFPIGEVNDAEVIVEPSSHELAALRTVDPHGIRHVEFMGGNGAARSAEIIADERREWSPP